MHPFSYSDFKTHEPRKTEFGSYRATWKQHDANGDPDTSDWNVQFFHNDRLLFERKRNSYHHSHCGYPHEFATLFLPVPGKSNDDEPVILFHSDHAEVSVLNIRGEELFKLDGVSDFICNVWYVESLQLLVFEEWIWQPFDWLSVGRWSNIYETKSIAGNASTAHSQYTDGSKQLLLSQQGVRVNPEVAKTDASQASPRDFPISQRESLGSLPDDDLAAGGTFISWEQVLKGTWRLSFEEEKELWDIAEP